MNTPLVVADTYWTGEILNTLFECGCVVRTSYAFTKDGTVGVSHPGTTCRVHLVQYQINRTKLNRTLIENNFEEAYKNGDHRSW